MLTVFIDLDGVLADIHSEIGCHLTHEDKPEQIHLKDFYRNLKVIWPAKQYVGWMLASPEIDLWIASKTPSNNTIAASEKMEWVNNHFPELKNKVFITPDKTLLKGDILIDDDLKWSHFDGLFIHFETQSSEKCWKDIKSKIISIIEKGN